MHNKSSLSTGSLKYVLRGDDTAAARSRHMQKAPDEDTQWTCVILVAFTYMHDSAACRCLRGGVREAFQSQYPATCSPFPLSYQVLTKEWYSGRYRRD